MTDLLHRLKFVYKKPKVTPAQEKALAEAATLVLQKKSDRSGGARGRKLELGERREVTVLIQQACEAGAPVWREPARCWR